MSDSKYGDIVSPLKAIRQFCVDCCGSSPKAVYDCGGEKSCALFAFRFGKNPFRKKTELTEEEIRMRTESLAKARAAKLMGKSEDEVDEQFEEDEDE